MKPFFVIFLIFSAASNAQAQGYDVPLDSLSEWTGKKSIRVVSNIEDLNTDKEFLALLGRLTVNGFDVKFGSSGPIDEGLTLEVLQVRDKTALSIKSTDSQKYFLSVLIDKANQDGGEIRAEAYTPSILPLPEDFSPKMVEALPRPSQKDSQLVFLSDSALVLGLFDGGRVKRIDELTSGIKNSKAIFLSVGQSDSDPNPEVAVVWGQDRDISGKGQYTKIFSQLFEISGQTLQEESEKAENVALRFINNQLHTQRYELLQGDIGKIAVTSGKQTNARNDSVVPADAGNMIFSYFPIDNATSIIVNEANLELRNSSWKSSPQLGLGKVSSPRLTKRLKDRKIITSPDYAFSVNEEHLSIPRKAVVNNGSVVTYLRKRRPGLSGLTSASGPDSLIKASWDSDTPESGFSISPMHEISSFIIDFSYVKNRGAFRLLVLTNEESDNQGARKIYIY